MKKTPNRPIKEFDSRVNLNSLSVSLVTLKIRTRKLKKEIATQTIGMIWKISV